MIINTTKLYLTPVYSYDIPSCHYSILENIGLDLSDIPKDDKLKRNIKIGQLMKTKENIKQIRQITTSVINRYITINNISEEDIIIRQYDGLLLNKPLTKQIDNSELTLELQDIFVSFLVNQAKDMFLAKSENRIKISGVPQRYDNIDYYLKKIMNANFLNKKSIFKNMQNIKDELLNSKNINDFVIKTKDANILYLKDFGKTTISDSVIKLLDVEEVDKQRYFEIYLKPFIDSIVIEFS